MLLCPPARSQEFLGFEWQSVYYVYTTLNFGMKVGAVHLHVLLEKDGRFPPPFGTEVLVLAGRYIGATISRPDTRTGPEAVSLGGCGGLYRT